jgi:hypothetical protein
MIQGFFIMVVSKMVLVEVKRKHFVLLYVAPLIRLWHPMYVIQWL